MSKFSQSNDFLSENLNLSFIDKEFKDLDLLNSIFENCIFINCKFENGKILSPTFKNCKFQYVSFERCILSHSTLSDVQVTSCNFKNCEISHSKFYNVNFLKVKFNKIDADFCEFQNGSLNKSKFSYTILSNSEFSDVDFNKLSLINFSTEYIILKNPINLAWTRELISELLLQHSNGLLKKEVVALLIRKRRDMCWDAWQKYAQDEERIIIEWVKSCFALYPNSKLLDAFNNEIKFRDN